MVVTAGHVVRDHDGAGLTFDAGAGAGGRGPVDVVERDEARDVAILRLAADTEVRLVSGRAVDGAAWRVDARPRPNDPQLTGTVTAARRRFANARGHEADGVQLLVDQVLEDYQGYSGSPVTSPDGVAIAVLVEQVRARGRPAAGVIPRATN